MKRHIPGLDGLRTVAVFAVILTHTWTDRFPGGGVGVDIFFVLSGYLITSLLLHEREATGRISLRRFYARRARRLLPAAMVAVAGAVVLALITRVALTATLGQAVAAVLYVANWRAAAGAAGLLGHTWSLSIEEQFYLVWPVALIALLRLGGRRLALAGAVSACVLIALHRLSVDPHAAYFRTDTRGDSLLIGCAVALLAAQDGFAHLSSRVIRWWALLGGVLLVVLALNSSSAFSAFYSYTLIALAAAGLVVAVAVRPTALARWLGWSPLVWVGRRSYGVYLYHYPLFYAVVEPHLGHGLIALLVTAPATLVIAAVSYRYLEQPLLRGRRRSAPVPAEVATLAA